MSVQLHYAYGTGPYSVHALARYDA